MSSTNTTTPAIAYHWHSWVTVRGQGRAFASGTVMVPLDYSHAQVLRDIAAWLGARGSTGRLTDIALMPAAPSSRSN